LRWNPHILCDGLELTMAELNTAPFVFRHIGGALTAATSLSLGAGQTGVRVSRKNEDEVFPPFILYAFTFGENHHPLLNLS
jgi:hypothetical protein